MWNVAGEYLKLARKSSNTVQLKGFCMVESPEISAGRCQRLVDNYAKYLQEVISAKRGAVLATVAKDIPTFSSKEYSI